MFLEIKVRKGMYIILICLFICFFVNLFVILNLYKVKLYDIIFVNVGRMNISNIVKR